MVIRGYGSCDTCSHRYILRAGVGAEAYQRHYVDCSECGTPIVVAVRAKPPSACFCAEENFHLEDEGRDKSTLINLHPNFAFDLSEYHDPNAFISHRYVERILPHIYNLPRPDRGLLDAALLFDVPNVVYVWSLVRRGLSLEDRDKNGKLMKRVLGAYIAERVKYRSETTAETLDAMVIGFLQSAFFPRFDSLFAPAYDLCRRAREDYPEQYEEFISFYHSTLAAEQKHRFVSTFSDYFSNYTQYTQMLVEARLGEASVTEKVVGSKAFEDVKLYYGQAYETLTTSFVIFGCINNILHGRRFDQFETMNLRKYMKDVEKAKRANPFRDQAAFYDLSEGLDSSLRNGSHHASIWRDGDLVYFRSGGSGAERDLAFSEYLRLCNVVTISLAVLWAIDRKMRQDK